MLGLQRGRRAESAPGNRPVVGDGAPEIHLFVLWDNARPWTDRIIEDISSRFRILDGIDLAWTCTLAPRHYTRLYRQWLPPDSFKVRECGIGRPLVLVVADDAPHYAERKNWGRTCTVNTRLFDAKWRYRRWVGGSRVHCSTNVREAAHDLFLLLGLRPEHYTQCRAPSWSGTFRRLQRDLTGNGGWQSGQELLTAIDLTLEYVTLPPIDNGPDIRVLLEGPWREWGIEWLVSEPERHSEGAMTGVYPVVVGSQEITVKFHHVEDGHHDPGWQKAMLRGRIRDADGGYVLGPDDAYLELLHELVLQGRATTSDAARLAGLAETTGRLMPDLSHPAVVAVELERHLRRRGYELSSRLIRQGRPL